VNLPAHGEVWWCEFPEIGRRPVVVLSRDAAIRGRRRVLLAPCSTNDRGLASEVRLSPENDPIPRDCVVSLDSVESASVAHLVERLGRLGSDRMHQICAALAVAVDCAQ
jgi:mRNA interferase MazF